MKRLLSLAIVLALILSVVMMPVTYAAGSATGQQIVDCAMQYIGKVPYVWGGETIDGANPGADCSGFICRIYEKFGFNFWKYRTALRNYGTNLGTDLNVAQLGDIIWYEGHVAIYAGTNGNGEHMIVHETGGSFQNVVYTKAKIVNAALKGVIRIPGIVNDGSTVTVSKASFTPAVEAEYTAKAFVTETNACVVNQVNKLSGVAVTQMGLYLYDANGSLLKRHIENVSNVSASQTKYHSWYDIQAELGLTLTPGTTYKYRFFGIFDGEEIVSETLYTLTTAGTAPQAQTQPNSYVIRIATDIEGGNIWFRNVTVGQPIGGFPDPIIPAGYTFTGYYTALSGGERVYDSTIFNGNGNTIYYAQFKKAEYVFPFKDVKANDWYHDDVLNAHKMGLINGKTQTRYGADENMTYAEAIKLAACMHQMYHKGKVTLKNDSSSKWYQTYVDYAKENSIPWNCADYNAEITRRDYVHIFYSALPEDCYVEINDVENIPDVGKKDAYSDEIYTFYRAGILSGNDSKGTFNPKGKIKRSEVATILSRMMDENARIMVSY